MVDSINPDQTMPEFLNQIADPAISISWITLILRLLLAFFLGVVTVGIYKATRQAASITATFPATLVLLAILIAMVTHVIGENIARAFSLVGALSVVRFRTVVRDTKDTAFVIVSVVVGMAVGAGQPLVAICGLVIIAIAAYFYRDHPNDQYLTNRDMNVSVKMQWSADLESKTTSVLTRLTKYHFPISASTGRQGPTVELTYQTRLLPATSLTQLINELCQLEGIQSVDVRKIKDDGA